MVIPIVLLTEDNLGSKYDSNLVTRTSCINCISTKMIIRLMGLSHDCVKNRFALCRRRSLNSSRSSHNIFMAHVNQYHGGAAEPRTVLTLIVLLASMPQDK